MKYVVYFLLGALSFTILYDRILWDTIIFPQLLTEPAIGRDLNIKKKFQDHYFPNQSTFVFGSSVALNGVNCHILEKSNNVVNGECFNLGIPGGDLSYKNYFLDTLALKPQNMIFVFEYDVFNPLFVNACQNANPTPLDKPQTLNNLLKEDTWSFNQFLNRWSYKNRLMDALLGINESKGSGRIGNEFKNPIFVLGNRGLQAVDDKTIKEVSRVFMPQDHLNTTTCSSNTLNILSAIKTIQYLSPQTRITIVIYPVQHIASLNINQGNQYLDHFAKDNHIHILNLINLLPSDMYWADLRHATAKGADKISEEIIHQLSGRY